MSFFQNKKRKGTFSENGPSSKQTCQNPLPAAPAPNNPQYIEISQITHQYNKKTNQEINSLKEIIESLKKELKQLKSDLSRMERRLSDQSTKYVQSSYERWDATPSYIS